MSLRCRLGFHALAGLIAVEGSGKFGARRCHRCHGAIGGVAITNTLRVLPPEVIPQPVQKPLSRIFWLQAVHEGKRAAQR
jgi:hypothetical protein